MPTPTAETVLEGPRVPGTGSFGFAPEGAYVTWMMTYLCRVHAGSGTGTVNSS